MNLRSFRGLRDRPFRCCLLAALFVVTSCHSRGPAAGPIEISLAAGDRPGEHVVRVTGLSADELRSLRDARLDPPAWEKLLRVTVTDNDIAAVAGTYAATDAGVVFRPRFGFDAGRSYTAEFNPTRLPAPRQTSAVVTRLRVDATPSAATSTRVTAVYPSAGVWPENMLRFYVHFSAPMSRGAGTRYVHLIDTAGSEIPDAILAAYADLWNPDATRLTVFFDPGRVKRGVGPNVALGRAIISGRRYAIQIDREWQDAHGQPLAVPFRREFTAGPAAYEALSTSDWRIGSPAANSREPLVVTFPRPLDRALLEHAMGVQASDDHDVSGTIEVGANEESWKFTPPNAWREGRYQLVVLTLLEDPAGNKIGRAFEVLPSQEPPDVQDVVRVPFRITMKDMKGS